MKINFKNPIFLITNRTRTFGRFLLLMAYTHGVNEIRTLLEDKKEKFNQKSLTIKPRAYFPFINFEFFIYCLKLKKLVFVKGIFAQVKRFTKFLLIHRYVNLILVIHIFIDRLDLIEFNQVSFKELVSFAEANRLETKDLLFKQLNLKG